MNILAECFPGPKEYYLTNPTDVVRDNGKNEWKYKREFAIPLEQSLEAHINGTSNKGVVLPPLVWNEEKQIYECIWGAIDIDGEIYKDDKFKKSILKKIQDTPFCVCFSKSKGLHLYIRFTDWVDAEKVLEILKSYLHKFGLPEDTECFPKQTKNVKMGNGIMFPFMKGYGNDWIKSFDDKGYTTGSLEEFKTHLFSKRVKAEDITIETPPEKKLNGSEPNSPGLKDFNESQSGFNKFEILKKIKDEVMEKHPTLGGKYYAWILVFIGKCVTSGFGDNEILQLIKEVHKENVGPYVFPYSYQDMINYTRKESRCDKPNPGETNKLKDKGLLDHFIDEELEKKQEAFFKDTIYIKFEDRWYSKKTGKEYKEKTIKVVNGHLFEKDVVRAFSQDEKRKQEVEMGVYRPDLFKNIQEPIIIDEDKLKQLNIYRPGGPKELPADTLDRKDELQLFKDLIKKLTEKELSGTNAKGEEFPLYDYVLDHLTMPFKYPGQKVRSCILMHSFKNQVGKSTVFEVCEKGLGPDNCQVITPENACRREKAFLQNQLVLIDEILIDGDYKKKQSVLNTLKPLMTSDMHDCRPLFKESRQVYSTCNFMCFTNHVDAISIEEHDARYTCLDINKDREEMGGSKFFSKIWTPQGQIRGTIVPVVKHFLSHRDLSPGFDAKAPSLRTKFIEVMSERGGHPLFTEVKSDIAQKEEPFRNPVVSISEAHKYYKKEKGTKGSLNELADALHKLGCVRLGECKHRRSRKAPILYIVRDNEFFKGKGNSEIANDYWLPIELKSDGISSETYNMSGHEVSEVRKHLEEVEAYEDLMDDDIIQVDEVTDIPGEIKRKQKEEENREEDKKRLERANNQPPKSYIEGEEI